MIRAILAFMFFGFALLDYGTAVYQHHFGTVEEATYWLASACFMALAGMCASSKEV